MCLQQARKQDSSILFLLRRFRVESGVGTHDSCPLSEQKMPTYRSNEVNQKPVLGVMEPIPRTNFTGVLNSSLNWFPTLKGRGVINWHPQTSRSWSQPDRIPEVHTEVWEMLNYRSHNLNKPNVGHMFTRIAGLPDTET